MIFYFGRYPLPVGRGSGFPFQFLRRKRRRAGFSLQSLTQLPYSDFRTFSIMKNSLNIAAIQADLAWENPAKNRAYFDQKITEITQQVDLIVLPEMFSTGFSMSPQQCADTGKMLGWMKEKAAQTGSALAGSLMIRKGDLYYNRFYFVTPEGDVTCYDKRHTFTLAGEHKVYKRGTEKVIVHYKGWKFLLQICYDLRFPAFARNLEDYDAVIYVANWPKKRVFAWDTLLKARAIEIGRAHV